MSNSLQQLSSFVRAERKANRLTQTDLAQMAGVGRRFVAELEAGKVSLQLEKVNDVLRVFGRQLGVVAETRGGTPSAGGEDAGEQ